MTTADPPLFTPAPAASEIPGWYAFEPFYRRAVAEAPPGATLVEVGVFCGRSLAGLARLAREADKGLTVVGVDTFRGSPEFEGRVFWHGLPWADMPRYEMAAMALRNLEDAGVAGDVLLVAADSVRAAGLFADRSCWMVFLDAAHDEESVLADLRAWSWKVADGGYLAGDDYHAFPGVKAAVRELLPQAVCPPGACWWETRPEGGGE